jgi:hypothetical protein
MDIQASDREVELANARKRTAKSTRPSMISAERSLHECNVMHSSAPLGYIHLQKSNIMLVKREIGRYLTTTM